MRKTSVKPHILSWLQPAPKARGKLIELSPVISTPQSKLKSKRADSALITRSCLGSTTATGILGMHGKPHSASGSDFGSKFRFLMQVAAALGLVFLLSPAKTPAAKIASQPKPVSASKALSGALTSASSEVTARN